MPNRWVIGFLGCECFRIMEQPSNIEPEKEYKFNNVVICSSLFPDIMHRDTTLLVYVQGSYTAKNDRALVFNTVSEMYKALHYMQKLGKLVTLDGRLKLTFLGEAYV